MHPSLFLSRFPRSFEVSQLIPDQETTSHPWHPLFCPARFVWRSLCRLSSTNRSWLVLPVVLPGSHSAWVQALFLLTAVSCLHSAPPQRERVHFFFLNGLVVHCVQWLLFTCTHKAKSLICPPLSFSCAVQKALPANRGSGGMRHAAKLLLWSRKGRQCVCVRANVFMWNRTWPTIHSPLT